MSTNPFDRLEEYRRGWGGVPILPGGERTPQADSEALEYANKFCNDNSIYRRRNLYRVARNIAFYKGQHDVVITKRLIESQTGGYVFERVRLPGGTTLVVDNCIPEGVDNDVARLLKNQYVPTVRPTRLEPRLQQAAARNKNLLKYDLDEMDWPAIAGQLYFDVVIGGTAIGRGYWDERVTDMVPVAHPDSAACGTSGCGTLLASQRVTQQEVGTGYFDQGDGAASPIQGLEQLQDAQLQPGEAMAWQMNACPKCGMDSLRRHTPMGQDLRQGVDIFGRPMGRFVPRGESGIQCASLFGIYAENSGVGVEPHTNGVWGYDSIRDLDWIAERYPEILQHLTTGDGTAMARLTPLLNDATAGSLGAGSDLFQHHAIFREVVVPKRDLPGLENGRLIRVACGQVVENRDLMQDVQFDDETRQIALVTFGGARYKRLPEEFYGRTPTDDAVPLNYQLDRAETQLKALRERGGPLMMLQEGTEIDWSDDINGALPIVTFRGAVPGFNPANSIMNGVPLTGNAYLPEIDRLRNRIRETLGPSAAESGENPTNTKTARQLELQIGEARQKRGPVEESTANLFAQLWTGHLERIWALRQETATYEVDDEADTFTQESYVGTDLLGQTQVTVDTENAQDQSVLQATRTLEAVERGLLDITDPVSRDQILKIMDVPRVDEQVSVQVKRAEEAWSEFVRHRTIPVVDESMDDPLIWFQVLGRRWNGDEGAQIRRKAGWSKILPKLARWKQPLRMLEAQDEQQRTLYEGRDPATWQQLYDDGELKRAAAAQGAMVTGAPPPPPLPPPPDRFAPESLQARVLSVLQDYVPGLAPDSGLADPMQLKQHAGATQDLRQFLEMYAVILTHKEQIERKGMAAQAGAMQAAAPGGGGPGGMGGMGA